MQPYAAFTPGVSQLQPGQISAPASRNITSQPTTIPAVPMPAPTGGWVTNLPIAMMPPNTALIMDNWFPRANTVDVINGYTPWATALGTAAQPVESLMAWNGPASKKLFGACNGNIFEVTNNAPVGAAVKTGYTNNRWQISQIGTAGGQFLLGVNGIDTPFIYDGSAWNDNALSGSFGSHTLNPDNLININTFKQRVFFIEANRLGFWYAPVSTVSGALQYFDLSQFSRLGGSLVAMGNWTREILNGVDIFAVFVTTEGEILLYQGNDPSDSSNWALVGNFFMGPPIGLRCLRPYGNDLMTISVDGYQLVSQVIVRERLNLTAQGQSIAFNFDNIQPTVINAAESYKNNFGWQVVHYPRQRMAIFNVPIIENTTIQQHVINTNTGAWCRFINMNACCWEVFNQNLYFGGTDGNVYLADAGQDFNGNGIQWELKTAFNYFDNPGVNKQFQMVQPVLLSTGSLTFNYGVDVDFGNVTPSFGDVITSASTPWGSPWGSPWSVAETIFQAWLSAGVTGRCAAFHMAGNTKDYTLRLAAVNWTFMAGGVL